MTLDDFRQAWIRACLCMPDHEEELCNLDSYIGDGDHGVTVTRGFLAASSSAGQAMDMRQLFFDIAESMSDAMGGAIGPLYGMFWRGIGKALAGDHIEADQLENAWRHGCEALMRIGRTHPGDKTIADAILPSVEAAQAPGSLPQRLLAMAKAARTGADATAHMQAARGRAHFLGEKTLGLMDPGACSYAIFMLHLAQEVAKQEETNHEEIAK